MKKQYTIIFLASFIFSVQLSLAQKGGCLAKLSWLPGTWKMQGKESVTLEEWSNAGLASLKCKSYEVKGADTTIIENATMSCIGGKQVFTYFPVSESLGDNRKPVNFVLVSEDNNTFVFENKAHDFPQRVIYQYISSNKCHAWIEGEKNGKTSKVDFFYERTK